ALRLERDAVVSGVVNPILPDARVRLAVIELDAVVGDVEDVVAVDVAVVVRVRDAVRDPRDGVIGHLVMVAVAELAPLADEALRPTHSEPHVADDRVVRNVPAARPRARADRMLESLEAIAAEHDVRHVGAHRLKARVVTVVEQRAVERRVARAVVAKLNPSNHRWLRRNTWMYEKTTSPSPAGRKTIGRSCVPERALSSTTPP